jgi:hypothetical protein
VFDGEYFDFLRRAEAGRCAKAPPRPPAAFHFLLLATNGLISALVFLQSKAKQSKATIATARKVQQQQRAGIRQPQRDRTVATQ